MNHQFAALWSTLNQLSDYGVSDSAARVVCELDLLTAVLNWSSTH
ncbi:MAG: hypothetical protein ACRC4N_04910 [Gammaproteobacteria bacterium]